MGLAIGEGMRFYRESQQQIEAERDADKLRREVSALAWKFDHHGRTLAIELRGEIGAYSADLVAEQLQLHPDVDEVSLTVVDTPGGLLAEAEGDPRAWRQLHGIRSMRR